MPTPPFDPLWSQEKSENLSGPVQSNGVPAGLVGTTVSEMLPEMGTPSGQRVSDRTRGYHRGPYTCGAPWGDCLTAPMPAAGASPSNANVHGVEWVEYGCVGM